MTHTPYKKQELIEQVSATIEGLSIIDGENVVLSWAEDDLLRVSSMLADFILARELQLYKSMPELYSTTAQPSSDYKVALPLDTEELEKQAKELIRQYDNRGFQIEPGDKKIHTREELIKQLLALFAQHIQVAGHQHKFVTHSVDMGEWTNVERYCEICGVDYKQLEQRKTKDK